MRLLPLLVTLGCDDGGKDNSGLSGDSAGGGQDSAPETGRNGLPVDEDCEVVGAPAGLVDIDPACEGWDAEITPVTDPWNVVIEWQYTSDGDGVCIMPAVGHLTDDNDDGALGVGDVPEIVFTTWVSGTLVALDGATGAELFTTGGMWAACGGVTIADVTSDGTPEIITFLSDLRIAAIDTTGAVIWSSGLFPLMSYLPQPTVADLDGDGDVEVIGDASVVDGATGATIADLDAARANFRTPVAADLDQDGSQEVIVGDAVYDAVGALLWTNDADGASSFSAVANVDDDIDGEVFFASHDTASLHDADGTLLATWTLVGDEAGPPCAADLDGDGEVEFATPSHPWLTVWDADGTELWSAVISDTSGQAGCSTYDFDGDGIYEVLYADEEALRIFDGATGEVRYTNADHTSRTAWEYPVVADVDNDGSAEIVLASNYGDWQGITVFGHVDDGWPAAGTAWGTHDFAMTNLETDGHVPSAPRASWLNHNVFRGRAAVDDDSASLPDLVVSVTDQCLTGCGEDGMLRLAWQVSNVGAVDAPAGTELALYMVTNGVYRPHSSTTLDAIPAGSSLVGQTEDIPARSLGADGYLLRVDDLGGGRDLLAECDEDNNTAEFVGTICY